MRTRRTKAELLALTRKAYTAWAKRKANESIISTPPVPALNRPFTWKEVETPLC